MVLTKTQFCRTLLEDYCRSEKLEPSMLDEEDILKSSTLAVAMEHLDMLRSADMQEYAASRGGVFKLLVEDNKPLIMSVRELLALLPD